MDLRKTAENMKARGFTVRCYATASEAAAALAEELRGRTVGIGGSMTVAQMGLAEMLERQGCTVYARSRSMSPAEAEQAGRAEGYISSANGIAETGEIVNIDGTGNRVAATLYGPQKLYLIAGRNKLAPTLQDAVWRARNIAAPLNARRLNKKTPCTVGEPKCHDCRSPKRICRGMTIHMAPMKGVGETIVVLIDEELGY